MSSLSLVTEHTDLVEDMAGTGAIFSLILSECTPDERISLLEHHGKVVHELRQRGHKVRAGVVYDEHGRENLTIRLVRQRDWSVLTP